MVFLSISSHLHVPMRQLLILIALPAHWQQAAQGPRTEARTMTGATSVTTASRVRRLLDARLGSSATELSRSQSASEGLLRQSTSGPNTAQPDAGTLIMAKMRGRFEVCLPA